MELSLRCCRLLQGSRHSSDKPERSGKSRHHHGSGREREGKSLSKREKLLQELDAINKVIERKKSKKRSHS